MGTWGIGIYQNDISEDVKNGYIEKLKSGKSDEEALQEILLEYRDEREDIDCKYDFFLGLADTLWKKGRLTEEIKTETLKIIEEDKISERWQSEKIRKRRGEILDKLKAELNSQMPARKRVAVHKPYVLWWEKGDVYTFQIKSKVEKYEEYTGWYVLFYVDKISKKDWIVKGIFDEVAEIYVFMTRDKPVDVGAIQSATPICFLQFNEKNQYRAVLHERSKRQRPNDLNFIGRCSAFIYPPNEFLQERVFFWGLHERDILWGYRRQIE